MRVDGNKYHLRLQMGFQASSLWLPTTYSFRPDGNIAASSNPQRHNNRLIQIAI